MEAIAEDRGSNPLSRTVEVQVEVVDRSNKPPVWDDLDRISRAVYVKENTAVGETVTTVRARSEKSKKIFFKKTDLRCFSTIIVLYVLLCPPTIIFHGSLMIFFTQNSFLRY